MIKQTQTVLDGMPAPQVELKEPGIFDSHTDPAFIETVLNALHTGGYSVEQDQRLPTVDADRTFRVDMLTQDDAGRPIFIKLQHQERAGTAEQKVAFKCLRLIDIVRGANLDAGRPATQGARAYMVLGGPGWTVLDYLTQELPHRLVDAACVQIIEVGEFVRKALAHQL